MCECERREERTLENFNKCSNSSRRLLMSQLTAGSSEVIKLSDGGARRTNRGGGWAPSFTACLPHPCPSLDEERILGLKDCVMNDTAGPGTLALYQTSHSE